MATPPKRAPAPIAAVCTGTPAVLADVETAPPAVVVLAVLVEPELPAVWLAPVATAEVALSTPLTRADSSDWSEEYRDPVVMLDSAATSEEESGARSEVSEANLLVTSPSRPDAALLASPSSEEAKSLASDFKPERASSLRLITGPGVTTGSRGTCKMLACKSSWLEHRVVK